MFLKVTACFLLFFVLVTSNLSSANEKEASPVELDPDTLIGVTGGKFNFFGFKSGISFKELIAPAKLNGMPNYASHANEEELSLTKRYKDGYEEYRIKFPLTYRDKTWETSDQYKNMKREIAKIISEREFWNSPDMYKEKSRFRKLSEIGFNFSPYFTDGKLWRLDVTFAKPGVQLPGASSLGLPSYFIPSGILKELAHRLFIEEYFAKNFTGVKMKTNSEGDYLFQFIDYDLANASIAAHKLAYATLLEGQ